MSMVAIYAGTHGFLDKLPPSAIGRYEKELISWVKAERPQVLKDIIQKKKLDDALESALDDALKTFAGIFEADK